MRKLLTCALAASMLVTLVPAGAAYADDDQAFAPYDETVTVTIGRENMPTLDLPDGEDIGNNKYVDYMNEALNIDVQYEWVVDSSAYDEKVNLAIASGDIPDVMYINSESQLKQLVDNDLIEDLTDYMQEYFSDELNEVYSNYGDFGLDSVKFDDRIMALPNLNGGYEFSFMWVRRDWVEKIGAEMPTTMDEVVELAKQFIEQDPNGNGEGKTIGIAVNTDVAGIYNNLGNIDPIFGTFKAFPRQWIRQEDGTVVYGSTTEECKEALEYIAGLYADGILDKEFAVRTSDDFNSLLLSGRCGIFFGPWWMPDWPLNTSLANDPEADWVPVLAPLDSDGNFNVYRQKPNDQWIVVRKGYEHPEIIFKMMSVVREHREDEDVLNFYPDRSVLWNIWPVTLMLRNNDTIPQDWYRLKNAVDTKDPSELTNEEMTTYEACLRYIETQDADDWQLYTCRLIGPEVTTSDKVVTFDNVYPAFTETMQLTWTSLEKLENEMILKTIMGEQSIDQFDTFVEQWNMLGGAEITEEVNAAYGN